MTSINKMTKKSDTIDKISQKLDFFSNTMLKTIDSNNIVTKMGAFSSNDNANCTLKISELKKKVDKCEEILASDKVNDDIFDLLQEINNELSTILKQFGCYSLKSLMLIIHGEKFLKNIMSNKLLNSKLDLLDSVVIPIGFKTLVCNNIKDAHLKDSKSSIVDELSISNHSDTFDCFDLAKSSTLFIKKVHGIKISIIHKETKKCFLIYGIVKNVPPQLVKSDILQSKISEFLSNVPGDKVFHTEIFKEFVKSLTVKDYLIYEPDDLYKLFIGINTQNSLTKQKHIQSVVRNFLSDTLYMQRNTLIQLLLCKDDPTFYYLGYLLYDLLSNDNNQSFDSTDQKNLYDSLPWSIRQNFKRAMLHTNSYTQRLANFDNSKIPIEQQICLMKTSDNVKEKAMQKLRSIKSKNEDSGTKAQQYLDGLLRIPFGIYKEEPILKKSKELQQSLSQSIHTMLKLHDDSYKDTHTMDSLEIRRNFKYIEENDLQNTIIKHIVERNSKKILGINSSKECISSIKAINAFIKQNKLVFRKIRSTASTKNEMRESIRKFLNKLSLYNNLYEEFLKHINIYDEYRITQSVIEKYNTSVKEWESSYDAIRNIRTILDDSVYGHDEAKRQIERTIGQWINGEQSGYCFGFEGPPGVGKTSMTKNGLSKILTDENGNNRPFGFIAIGGSSNGSLLTGHSYTYVGSTWGRICDILMESKCMNPIIFIDELDKISNTESGRELIGILTHLVDTTQNDSFQDKYFNGIDLDLSKALFIFSYNDPSAIDKILLDRIHRVKFSHLELADKITICHKFLLPEIFKKVNLNNNIIFTDELLTFIINKYTNEPGVRKLKQLLHEIVGEINLHILMGTYNIDQLPITLTEYDVQHVYLKERRPIIIRPIHNKPTVGVINGLWANALGQGGVIPIQAKFYRSKSPLELKLTGMQGDVMKESMNVSRTVALSHYNFDNVDISNDTIMNNGIHIHCPEGATPKDGPSAGTAISVCLISLLLNRPIKHNIAITGEINLEGNVTAIGGLDLKILGGIRAGVDTFIYPQENQIDFDKFHKKYEHNPVLNGVTFHPVSKLDEVLELVF
jgi:ATP-dependent Lon protease